MDSSVEPIHCFTSVVSFDHTSSHFKPLKEKEWGTGGDKELAGSLQGAEKNH